MVHPWLTRNGTMPIPNHVYKPAPCNNKLELKLNFITPEINNGSTSSAREYNLDEISDIDDSSYSESD
jgi:hypothetical protein